jgi:hypothetical protein
VVARAGRAEARLAVAVVPNTVRAVAIEGGAAAARAGDVLRFRAVARDAAGRPVAGVAPAWSMTPGEGMVDQDGAFVAYSAGTYTLTASVGGASAQAVVRVRPRDVRRPATVLGRVPIAKLPTAEFWPHPDGRHAYLSTIGDRMYALDISDPARAAHHRLGGGRRARGERRDDHGRRPVGRDDARGRVEPAQRHRGALARGPGAPEAGGEYTETVTGGVHSTFVYTQPRHGTHVYLTDDATGRCG